MEEKQDREGYGYNESECLSGKFLNILSFVSVCLRTLASSKDKMAKHRLQCVMLVNFIRPVLVLK